MPKKLVASRRGILRLVLAFAMMQLNGCAAYRLGAAYVAPVTYQVALACKMAGKVLVPGGIISNNSSKIVSNNSSKYVVAEEDALVPLPLGSRVTLEDAWGNPLAEGSIFNDQGEYQFDFKGDTIPLGFIRVYLGDWAIAAAPVSFPGGNGRRIVTDIGVLSTLRALATKVLVAKDLDLNQLAALLQKQQAATPTPEAVAAANNLMQVAVLAPAQMNNILKVVPTKGEDQAYLANVRQIIQNTVDTNGGEAKSNLELSPLMAAMLNEAQQITPILTQDATTSIEIQPGVYNPTDPEAIL